LIRLSEFRGPPQPPLDPDHLDRPLRIRAALTSTLVAALELARDGAARIEEDRPFGAIRLRLSQNTGSVTP
ncbi:hypothetical protein RQ832_10450, partial [Roseomonas sp. DSM 102946]|nr:hypothetical protein [Roseomonas sp. DSM 102946]